MERSHPVVVGEVHLGAAFDEECDHLIVSIERGIVERRCALLVADPDTGAVVEEQSRHGDVAEGGGKVEGGLAVGGVARVRVGATVEEQACHLHAPEGRREHQRRPPLGVARVDVGAAVELACRPVDEVLKRRGMEGIGSARLGNRVRVAQRDGTPRRRGYRLLARWGTGCLERKGRDLHAGGS